MTRQGAWAVRLLQSQEDFLVGVCFQYNENYESKIVYDQISGSENAKNIVYK